MKNFLQALDTIDKNVKITLKIKVISENGYPMVKIKYNQRLIISGILTKDEIFEFDDDINNSMKFEVELENKVYNETRETAIIIECITVDGINLIPDYVHLCDYKNDHNLNIKTHYIGYNGIWSLHINEPFYIWHHNVSGQGMLIKP